MNIVAHWGFVCKLFLLRKGALTVENKIITKNKMKRIFTHLFVAVLLMLSTTSWAQLQRGVYNIVNVATNTSSMTTSGTDRVVLKVTDTGDNAQLWYVEPGNTDDSYTVRNVENGLYLQGAGGSQKWTLSTTSSDLYYVVAGDNHTLSLTNSSNDYDNMHYGANEGYVVGWGTSASATQWVFNKVEMSDSELQANWDAIGDLHSEMNKVATYQALLDNIFSDKSCTAFKDGYSYSTNEANYAALPHELQAMVTKINARNWEEPNAVSGKPSWNNDYAKKFRVQMYEPYSYARTGSDGVTSWLGINWHSNNDNPTGVYIHKRGLVYVMVQGEIAQGASLRIVDAGSNNRIANVEELGYELKTGLNVIPCYGSGGMLYICYNVDTYNHEGKTAAERFPENRKLSNYAPLKIHIEGGAINGFYNACGDFRATTDAEDLWKTFTGASVDKDADWEYMEERANLSVLPILGHREILLLQFEDESGQRGLKSLLPESVNCPSTPYSYAQSWAEYGMGCDPSTGKINIVMEAWDRIMYSQLATMGLLSKADMAKMNDFYPRWNADGTRAEIYDYSNLEDFCGVDYSEYFNHHGSILGTGGGNPYGSGDHVGYPIQGFGAAVYDLPNTAGSTWGPAHEIGHQHQGLLTLNGLTEVTNNLFSNIALWYKGMSTSRYNGNEGSLESVLNAFNSVGSDIYTNNIWALTHLYYRLWLYYHLAGNNTQFYPRLFELLRNEQMQKGYNVSGDVSTLHFYKLTCQAAGEDLTEFFRAHGYFSVMEDRFVGDYSNSIYNVSQAMIDEAIAEVKAMRDAEGNPLKENLSIIFINDDDDTATYLQHDGKTQRVIYGETTPNSDFGSVTDFIAGNVATTPYTATLNSDGTLTMSGGEGGVGFLILNDQGELISFSNKSTFVLSDEVKHLLLTGKVTIVSVDSKSNTIESEIDLSQFQKAILESMIADVEAMPIDDGTYTHIGFYKEAYTADMLAALEKANSVLEAGNGGYAAAYEILNSEYLKVKEANEVVPFDASLKYTLTNYAYNQRKLTVSDGTVIALTGVDNSSTAAQWTFESAGDGVYKVKNGDNAYCATISTSNPLRTTNDAANAATYIVEDLGDGLWTISLTPQATQTSFHSASNDSYKVVGWGAGAESPASRWYLTALQAKEGTAEVDELQALIAKTEALVNEVAAVSLKGKVQLQADNANSAFFITSNATEAGHEPKYLLDNNVSTFFHTVWTGTSPGADHYLQIDLGEELPIDQFVLKYTNLPSSSWNVDAANTIKVQGANIIDEFTDITTLTDLPTAKEGTYTSATLGAKGTNYRYIRLTVTNATGGKFDNHYYFGMSEFSLERLNSYSKVKDVYTDHITQNVVATVADKLVDAKTAIANSGDIAAAKDALQEAYNALLLEYNGVADAKKTELQELIDATNELIAQVGEATVIAGANVDLLGKLYAERPYTAGGTGHSDYSSAENGYNLLDDDVNTHFHSDYNTSSMVSPPYLRVDLGKGNSARKVNFNYTTRKAGGCAPTIINVYGGVAGVEYSQGAIQSSVALNAVTVPTKIVIKNLSGTNSKYFAGTSNETDINDAVLVWEPVDEGKAGKYYLRTTDAESGYIQNGNTTVVLGTKDNAQVFVTTSPSTTGTDGTYFDGESLVNADLGNLVRFVQEGGSTWLNVQHGDTGTPRLGHTGKGGWTVHNVYLVTETENDTPSYDATPIATFTSSDATNPLPTGTSAKWTSADMESTKDYRFFKFEVAESQGSNSGGYYFAISEFGFNKVGEVSATIKAEYQGLVSEELLIETRRAVNSSEVMLDYSNDIELLDAQIVTLQAAKDALEEAMVSRSALKAQLFKLMGSAQGLYQEIADETNGVVDALYCPAITQNDIDELITAIQNSSSVYENTAATLSEIRESINGLTAVYERLDAVKSANYLERENLQTLITDIKEKLLKRIADERESIVAIPLQATNENEAFYIWCNAPAGDSDGVAGIIDKNSDGTANTGTFLGTDYSSNVSVYTHYIEVDLGAAVTIDQLTMDYTTRDNSSYGDQRPNAIKILGSNDKVNYTEITEITTGLTTGQCQKWAMETPLELGGHYRYIRVAVGSERGFFHMSDFNLYTVLSHTLKEYYTTAEELGYNELCLALETAENALGHYLTEAQYTAILDNLLYCYNITREVYGDDYLNRTDLETLIQNTNELIETIAASVTEVETPVLSTANVYCNADNSTNSGAGAGDKRGVAALFDGNVNTHLHTTYGNNKQDDDLDHYIRVDMGDGKAVQAFKFNYIGRASNSNNDPSTIVVQACNTVNGDWVTVKTLNGLPTAGDAVKYTSPLIEMKEAYRYVRFMVTATQNGSTTTYDGVTHKFFVMSEFGFTAYPAVVANEGYEINPSPVLVMDAFTTVNEAEEDNKHYMLEADYNAIKDKLQAAYDALNAALSAKDLPVRLTTDASNPALYKIYINRTYPKTVLGYAANTTNVGVENMASSTANAQSWYFMQGTDGCVLILPYTAGGKVLATNDFSEGNSKVVAKNKDSEGFSQNWEISKIDGKEWYNIKIKNTGGTYYYFSNHGGVSNKMGFYNSNPSGDGGSMFRFVPDDVYSVLEDYHATLDKEPEYYASGYYTNAEAYNNAYDAVRGYIEKRNGTEAVCIAAFYELIEQNNAKTTYKRSDDLVDGAVYRIMNLITNTPTQYKYHYIANSSATIAFPTEPADDGSDLWVCIKDGETYKFVSALGTLSLGWKQGGEDAQAFAVADGFVDGAKRLKNGNTAMALTNEKWGTLGFNQAGNDGNTQSANWSTDWFFQKVANASVAFNVSISSRRFSSIYLPYNVTVPNGVSAFTAVAVDGGYVDLYRVADNDDNTAAGKIIPARTPVILYIEDDNAVPASSVPFTFEYTTEDASLSQAIQEQISEAIIYGKILQTPVLCEDGYRYYKLGSKSGDSVSKMYWMYKEYSSDGVIANGNAGTDNGGYIRCGANKIYMRVPDGGAQNAFSMRFDGATTGIDEVKGEPTVDASQNGEVKTIYDMQGRKLSEITMPGVYIVNGKKVVVK